jgi:hypothetical protein
MRLSGAGASRLSVPLQILPSVRANIKNTAEPLLLVVPWPAAKQNLVYGIFFFALEFIREQTNTTLYLRTRQGGHHQWLRFFYDYVSCHNLLIRKRL